MRILEKKKIPFFHLTYECEEFIDGAQIADMLKLPHEKIFKTLVTIGTDKNYYVVQAKELESMIVSGGRIGSQIELKPFDLCKVTMHLLKKSVLSKLHDKAHRIKRSVEDDITITRDWKSNMREDKIVLF